MAVEDMKEIPESQLKTLRTKARGAGVKQRAIDAFCKYCIYDAGAEGGWRQQVGACAAKDCPLYQLRPVSTGAKR